ncbi:Golgi-associated plant pathogenesis-related protein 1 [Halotydeus destructor]|nr:Golgi-associated plant pathogenesis-related protein 1 [Halotydeus destructor]
MRHYVIYLGLTCIQIVSAGRYHDYTTESFQERCLTSHNQLRNKHGARPLIVDPKLVAFARHRAKTLSETELLVHDARGRGENLAWDWSLDSGTKLAPPVDCSLIVNDWYNEIKYYNFQRPNQMPINIIGHFTQVVWRSTDKVGCAQAGSVGGNKGGVYTVCNYDPPGNRQGLFIANVTPKLTRHPVVFACTKILVMLRNAKCYRKKILGHVTAS